MARSLQENLARQLCDSIERLHKQLESVEFWASAIRGASAPIPGDQPDEAAFARLVKPGRRPKRRRIARRRRTKDAKPASA